MATIALKKWVLQAEWTYKKQLLHCYIQTILFLLLNSGKSEKWGESEIIQFSSSSMSVLILHHDRRTNPGFTAVWMCLWSLQERQMRKSDAAVESQVVHFAGGHISPPSLAHAFILITPLI